MLRKLISLVAVSLLLVSCAGGVLHPAVGPGTDWPCGTQGKSCGNHQCCWLDEDCGGGPFNGCPAGYCCYNGGDDGDMLQCHPRREHQMFDEDMASGKIVRDSCK